MRGCWQHAGDWTGIYDLSPKVQFTLSGAHGLEVRQSWEARTRKYSMRIQSVALFTSAVE